VLASLADGPKHGHAMIDDIEELCGAGMRVLRAKLTTLRHFARVGSRRIEAV
jgi:hypothetical protein